MFKNDFIVAVRCGGQILRETGDIVSMPFGSEYSLLLKNKSSRIAVIKVEIDGQDVMEGQRLVVYPNRETDLKGFFSGRFVKNRFKFIQKTKEIAEHRGDKVDDGIIRVEFQYEKRVQETIQETVIHRNHYYDDWWWRYTNPYHPHYPPFYRPDTFYCSSGTTDMYKGASTLTASNCVSSGDATLCASSESVAPGVHITGSAGISSAPEIPKDEGITVKGSEANQAFNTVQTNELESNSEVMIIRLKGTTNGDKVKQPITVTTSFQCETCGRTSKSSVKFCDNCGTALR